MIKEIRIYFKLRPYIKKLKELMKMKLSVNLVIQVLMLILQAYNQLSGLLSPELRQVATLVMGIVQAVVALLAHYKNPDGTPATIAYKPTKNNIPTIKLMLILIFGSAFCLPNLQAQEETKRFGAVGITVDQTAEKSLAGWLALGIPFKDKIVNFTDFDVAVVKGTTWQQALKNEGVQYTIRTGIAVKLFSPFKGISVWGLGDAGIAAGGLEGYTGQAVVSGSYAGGGFVHIGNEKVGGLIILQVDKNATTGRTFVPRVGIRIKL